MHFVVKEYIHMAYKFAQIAFYQYISLDKGHTLVPEHALSLESKAYIPLRRKNIRVGHFT